MTIAIPLVLLTGLISGLMLTSSATDDKQATLFFHVTLRHRASDLGILWAWLTFSKTLFVTALILRTLCLMQTPFVFKQPRIIYLLTTAFGTTCLLFLFGDPFALGSLIRSSFMIVTIVVVVTAAVFGDKFRGGKFDAVLQSPTRLWVKWNSDIAEALQRVFWPLISVIWIQIPVVIVNIARIALRLLNAGGPQKILATMLLALLLCY